MALGFAIGFVVALPTTPRDDAEGWISPLGVKPLGDDASEYLDLADSIRLNHEYSYQGQPTRMRPPLYPLFLAGIQGLFGTNLRFIQAAQVVLIAATLVVFYLLVGRVFGNKVAVVAAFLLSLYVPFTVRAALVMSEVLFIFLLFLALYLVISAIQEHKVKYYVAAGAILGLASLTRPIIVFLPLILIPLLIMVTRQQIGPRFALKQSALFLSTFLLVLLPWGIRNGATLGEFTPLPSSGGVNLWVATHPDWKPFVKQHMAYAWPLEEFLAIKQRDSYISSEADERFFDQALENIKADPGGWLARSSKKLAWVGYYSFAQELRPAAEERKRSTNSSRLLRVTDFATVVFILLAIFGVARTALRKEAGIPQIKPTFLDIAPSGIPSIIIPHSKGVKCGLIRSNSPFSYSNHRPAKPKIPKPLVYAQVSPLGTSFATP